MHFYNLNMQKNIPLSKLLTKGIIQPRLNHFKIKRKTVFTKTPT